MLMRGIVFVITVLRVLQSVSLFFERNSSENNKQIDDVEDKTKNGKGFGNKSGSNACDYQKRDDSNDKPKDLQAHSKFKASGHVKCSGHRRCCELENIHGGHP